MGFAQEIASQLEAIKRTLRERMEQCLERSDYRELREVARMAEVIDVAIAGTLQRPQGAAKVEGLKGKAANPPQSKPLPAHDPKVELRPQVAPRSTDARYPLFWKDEDKLVKVAWSAKAQQEYEHRAPRTAIRSLIDRVENKVGSGKLFLADEILPVPDEDSSNPLPTYQVYLVLAWLRSCGVIEKIGRDQYRLMLSGDAERVVKKHWMDLPSK